MAKRGRPSKHCELDDKILEVKEDWHQLCRDRTESIERWDKFVEEKRQEWMDAVRKRDAAKIEWKLRIDEKRKVFHELEALR